MVSRETSTPQEAPKPLKQHHLPEGLALIEGIKRLVKVL
jgi:hypothetical protein